MFPAMSLSKSVSAYSPSSSSNLKITSVVVAAAVTSDNAITKAGAAFLMQISAFSVFPSTFELMFELAGPERAKNLAVDKSPPDSDPLSVAEYGKIVFSLFKTIRRRLESQIRAAQNNCLRCRRTLCQLVSNWYPVRPQSTVKQMI